jgi:hypothetical protein
LELKMALEVAFWLKSGSNNTSLNEYYCRRLNLFIFFLLFETSSLFLVWVKNKWLGNCFVIQNSNTKYFLQSVIFLQRELWIRFWDLPGLFLHSRFLLHPIQLLHLLPVSLVRDSDKEIVEGVFGTYTWSVPSLSPPSQLFYLLLFGSFEVGQI